MSLPYNIIDVYNWGHLLCFKQSVRSGDLCQFSVVDVVLALSTEHIAIAEFNVQEMFFSFGMLLDVAAVAGKVDAVQAWVQPRTRLPTGKAQAWCRLKIVY